MREGWRWEYSGSIHPHLDVCVSNPNVWPKNGKQKQEQNKQTFRRSLSSWWNPFVRNKHAWYTILCVWWAPPRKGYCFCQRASTYFVRFCFGCFAYVYIHYTHTHARVVCALEPCAGCSYKARIHRFAAGSWLDDDTRCSCERMYQFTFPHSHSLYLN